MKATHAAYLILLGSASASFASARFLQVDSNSSITTDEIVSPIDLVADDNVASPTQPAAATDASNDPTVTSTLATDEIVNPIDLVANNATEGETQPATTTDAPNDPVVTTAAPTDPIDTSVSSTEEQSSGTPTSSGTTLVFDNGDQNTLDPNEISGTNNIQVTNYSTLFITDDSITISGYCDDCVFPNSTIDVLESSNLIIEGDDISIYGTNQASIINDAGGSAIELRSSRGKIGGSVMIRGGDGDNTAGIGGDALGLHDESSVDISGDVILQGGVGVEAGKALMVDTGSTAQINSGTYKSEVWVENGSIHVYGGTFESGVSVNGGEASATFNGCFATTITEDMELLRSIELSGMFSNSTEMQTIEVTLVDGAVLKTVGGSSCEDASITTDNNTVTDDESGEYVGNTSTYAPTFMPTAFSHSVRSTPNTFISMGVAAGLLMVMISF